MSDVLNNEHEDSMEENIKHEEQLSSGVIIDSYFDGFTKESFNDSQSQWEAWQRFIDMLLMLKLMQKDKKDPLVYDQIGVFLEDDELYEALKPHDRAEFDEWERVRSIFEMLLLKGKPAEGESIALPLSRFLNTGVLENIEILAFLVAVSYAKSRKYERIFGRLINDPSLGGRPTVGFVCDLGSMFLTEKENNSGILDRDSSFLNRFLLENDGAQHFRIGASRVLSLHGRALAAVSGNRLSLSRAESFCSILGDNSEPEPVIYHDEEMEELMNAYGVLTSYPMGGVIFLHGAEGIGKRFMIRQLALSAKRTAIYVGLSRLLCLAEDDVREILRDIVLKCCFENQLLYIDMKGTERFEHTRLQRVLLFIQGYLRIIAIGSPELLPRGLTLSGTTYTIELAAPKRSVQRTFWEYFADELDVSFTDDIDLDRLVSVYSLTPEKIRQALVTATLVAEISENGFIVTKELLEAKIRQACDVRFGDYATRLESPFTWNDLELTGLSKRLITSAINRVRYRRVVNEDYGFNKKLPYGKGVVIALYGPPGTGKTMTAQVLAKELGMDIYRIDLSQIGSKYIGETEKNLGEVFEAAKNSNAILFFDEADALFTKRTDVLSSNDKYSNAQTAYLLQKMEEYQGVSVLATNVMQNFDNAFKRRMTFVIPLEQPDEAARLKLWQKVFPKDAPLGEGIDFEILASVAKVTGSNIKSAALAASYEAAAGGRTISMRDIVSALDEEYKKLGHMSIAEEIYSAIMKKENM